MSKKKIIVVIDDDKELLEEINEILELNGYESKTFSDGDTALRMLDDTLADLILLDLKMNGKSGFEIVKELKQNSKTAKIPVIAVSGYFNGNKLNDLIDEYGFEKCLIKPLSPNQIIYEIKNILN